MNKRGSEEYTLAIIIEYVSLILLIVLLSMYVYKYPHEERINKLKTIDLSLSLDAVSSVKDKLYLNFDLGKGMNVDIENDEVKVYKKSREKAGEEKIVRNSNYNYEDLPKNKYEDLFIIKDENGIKIEGGKVKDE